MKSIHVGKGLLAQQNWVRIEISDSTQFAMLFASCRGSGHLTLTVRLTFGTAAEEHVRPGFIVALRNKEIISKIYFSPGGAYG